MRKNFLFFFISVEIKREQQYKRPSPKKNPTLIYFNSGIWLLNGYFVQKNKDMPAYTRVKLTLFLFFITSKQQGYEHKKEGEECAGRVRTCWRGRRIYARTGEQGCWKNRQLSLPISRRPPATVNFFGFCQLLAEFSGQSGEKFGLRGQIHLLFSEINCKKS